MSLANTGQPQNVQLTSGGNDVSASNPIPIAPNTTASSPSSLDDTTATGSAVALGSLVAGPGGIVVTAHPSNPVGSVVRVGGSDITTTRGQPLGPGASYTWTSVRNANQLSIIIETGTAPKVCVSQV